MKNTTLISRDVQKNFSVLQGPTVNFLYSSELAQGEEHNSDEDDIKQDHDERDD